jgi:hypothetical protein
MKTLYIDRALFIDWYFSDSDDFERIGEMASEGLSDSGSFTITAENLWEECAVLPTDVIKDWDKTGYPKDSEVDCLIEEGAIPKSFWDEYEVKMEAEE